MSKSIVIDVVAGEIVVGGEAVTDTQNNFSTTTANNFYNQLNGARLASAADALLSNIESPDYYGAIKTKEKREQLCELVVEASSDREPFTESQVELFLNIANPAAPTFSSANFGGCIRLPNGKIFMAPTTASRGIVYDPITKKQTLTPAVPRSTTNAAYLGACLLPDGGVFCVPYNSTYAAIYNPTTDTWTQTATHGAGTTSAFWGGVVVNGGKVVCVPFASATVRIYDPSNDTWAIGPTHAAGSNAFKEGITLPDGRVFFSPWNSSTGYIYNPTSNTGSATAAHGVGSNANAFNGATLMRDGRIFCNAYSTSAPRAYDPVANTWTTLASFTTEWNYITCSTVLDDNGFIFCYSLGPGSLHSYSGAWVYNIGSNNWARLGSSTNKYIGSGIQLGSPGDSVSCCLMDNFNVILAPFCSNMIQIYKTTDRSPANVSTTSTSTVSNNLPVLSTSRHSTDAAAWIGGTTFSTYSSVYGHFLPQYNADTSYHVVNTQSGMRWVPCQKIGAAGAGLFTDAILFQNGDIFCVPYNATSAYIFPFLNQPNPIVSTPTLTSVHGAGSAAFWGGVSLPDGRIFCVPYNATAARIYDRSNDTWTTTSVHGAGTGAFMRGALLPDGRVFCVPYNAGAARIYNPADDTWTTLTGHGLGASAFKDCIIYRNSSGTSVNVLCIPRSAASVVIYHISTGTITTTAVHNSGAQAFSAISMSIVSDSSPPSFTADFFPFTPSQTTSTSIIRRYTSSSNTWTNTTNSMRDSSALGYNPTIYQDAQMFYNPSATISKSSPTIYPRSAGQSCAFSIPYSGYSFFSRYSVPNLRGFRASILMPNGKTLVVPETAGMPIIEINEVGSSFITRSTTLDKSQGGDDFMFGSPCLTNDGKVFLPSAIMSFQTQNVYNPAANLESPTWDGILPAPYSSSQDHAHFYNSILHPNGKIYTYGAYGIYERSETGAVISYTRKYGTVSSASAANSTTQDFSTGVTLCLLKDGRILSYDDGRLAIFDPETGRYGVFASSVGGALGSDGITEGYRTYEKLARYEENCGSCIQLPDGRIFVYSETSGEARLYNIETGFYLSLGMPLSGDRRARSIHSTYYGAVLLSAEEVFLAPRSSYHGLIFDVKNNIIHKADAWTPTNTTQTSTGLMSGCVRLTNGKILITPGSDNVLRIYDPNRPAVQLASRHNGGGSKVIDAITMTNGSVFLLTRDNWAWLYNPTTDTWKKTSHGNFHWTSVDGFNGILALPNSRVFCVPKNSNTAWIYDGSADTWTSTRTYPGTRTDNAFWGGVLLSDGRIFCVPYSRTAGAIYNPSTGAWSDTAVHGAGATAFRRGVLLSDGRIFCVPYTATTAGIYNPTTNTWTLTSAHGAGSNNFEGAVLLSNGKVLVANQNTSVQPRLYDITANTWTSTTIGATGGRIPVLLQNGNVFVPRQYTISSSRIYNPTSNTVSNVGTTAMDYETNPMGNSCLLNDGRVFMSPNATSYGRIYNPTTNNITLTSRVEGTDASESAFFGGSLMKDGRVFLASRASQYSMIYNPKTDSWFETAHDGQTTNQRYCGSVTLENGNILCVPYSNVTPRIYNPTTNAWTVTGTAPGIFAAYVTPIKLSDGRIFCVPHSRTVGTIYNPTTNTWSDTSAHGGGSTAFYGAIQLDSDRIFCSPSSALNAYIYTISSNTWTATPAHGAGAGGLRNCVFIPARFVGGSGKIFCLPYGSQSGRLYDIASNTWTSTVSSGVTNLSIAGFLMEDGRVFIVPRDGQQPFIYDPYENTYERFGAFGTAVKNGYASFTDAVQLQDNRIFCLPHNFGRAAIYTLPRPKYSDMLNGVKRKNTPDVISLSPLFNTK